MTDPRPAPDELLARLRDAETRAARGRLKIFFGASPGVGKTFAMLEEARARRAEGVDVVAGLVETHGRSETAAQLAGLEQLPRKTFDYRGVAVTEFDLDAALQRHPAILLLDELAHTNATGSRHERRWQDVAELLAAGISVHTTLNVQHLESLNDLVARITGVRVRETVPDAVFDEADEVELADLTPEDLLTRMQQGKVYLPEVAERARERFFRKGNLIALRELALRRVAERVDAQRRGYLREHGVRETGAVGERLLVCVDESARGPGMVRAGRRLATLLRCDWTVLHVETGTPGVVAPPRGALIDTLQLAEELGAATVTIAGRRAAEEIVAWSAANHISRILVGRPSPRPRWQWWRPSTVDRLVRETRTEVQVVTPEEQLRREDTPPARRSVPVPYREYGSGLVVVALCSLLGWLVCQRLSVTDVAMIYLLGAMIVASRSGRGPSLVAALLSILAFDLLFVPPRFSLEVTDLTYVLTFGTMLVVALLISGYTLRLREQAARARERERRTAALYALSRDLGATRNRDDVVAAARQHLADGFDCQLQLVAPGPDGRLMPLQPVAAEPLLDEKELGVADWAYRRAEPAGAGTATLPGARALHLPLNGTGGPVGVLVIASPELARFQEPSQRHLLETFAGQIGVALERVTLAERARQTRLEVEAERLRTSLLSSLSHDLRTPLGIIQGSASSLREAGDRMRPEDRTALLDSILEESDRMNRLIRNLLDMIRVETGTLQVQKEWQPLEDAVGVALIRMGDRLANHPVDVRLPPEMALIPLDSVLLEQVFINLLENAVKYTPPGTPIEITALDHPEVVTVTVADRGPGLVHGEEALIFEKFFRTAEAPVGAGVGLGLAICRGIVMAHGGRIWAENRVDGGAAFHFTLPRTGPAPSPVPSEPGEPPA
jgi:two-component system sensor histidine kinase KdpD